MDFTNVIYAAAALSVLGLVFGALLAFAAKVFSVKRDERFEPILEALPGANCGGCGLSGCANFAQALIDGYARVDGCPVGGSEVAVRLAEIMGTETGEYVRQVAHVFCRGGNNTKKKYLYRGIRDCAAASKLLGGSIECRFGCLGYGSCMDACRFDAIEISQGVAVVHADKCTACGKCMESCPRHIISIVPYTQDVVVSCSSKDKGGALRKICNIGCLGCKICEKKCPTQAIHIDDNLARIDYSKCTNCGICAEVCPRKLIMNASEMTTETNEELA